MERKSFETSPCPIARSLDVLGDWWNPLILRECLYGSRKFDEFQGWLGISRNILSRRLTVLVEQGLLEKHAYQASPKRFEYRLTDKGYDACSVLMVLMPFGERWHFEKGSEPITLYDRTSGDSVEPMVINAKTGEPIDPRQLVAGPGPGFKAPEEIKKSRFNEYYSTFGRAG